MAAKKLVDTIAELAAPIALENNCFVDDVEYKKEGSDYVLRIIIDTDSEGGGISIDQCENVSRALSDVLDETDPIKEAYMLEVSSPGIDRELKKEKDFVRFMGHDVDIKLYKARNSQKLVSGKLTGYDNGAVTIDDGEQIKLEKGEYSSVRLSVKW